MQETLTDYLRRWLDGLYGLAPRTIDCYRSVIRLHIETVIGDVTLHAVDRLHIQLAIDAAASKPRTAQLVHVVLSKALGDAHEAGLIADNPVRQVRVPRHRPEPMTVWDDDQIAAYIDAALRDRHAAAWLLAIQCGLRRGEICGLRWADVDLARRVLHVCNQRQRLDDGRIVDLPPKSACGIRYVPISSMLAMVLEAEDRHKPYVVGLTPSGLDRAHRQLLACLRLPYIHLHALRHTMATAAIRHGSSLRALQVILGHADVSTTTRIYTHPDLDMLRQVIDAVTIM